MMSDEATLAQTARSPASVAAAIIIPVAAAAAAAAAADVPLSSNPQEEQFLKARLARFNDNNHHTTTRNSSKRDALHAFWTILRRKLSHWNERLVTVETTYQNTDNNNTNNNNKNNNNKQDGLDALERLRLELEQWRKHCMSTVHVDSNYKDKTADNDDQWLVPEDLPLTDLKLLHSEFTKFSDQWETVRDRLFPKGEFVFRRYREALARRNIRQDDFAAQDQDQQQKKKQQQQQQQQQQHTEKRNSPPETAHNNNNNNNKYQSSTAYGTGGAVLENLSHVSLVIDTNGKVQQASTTPAIGATFQGDECTDATVVDPNSVEKAAKTTLPQILSSSLLIRSLQHCLVILHWPLQGLHLMNLSHVTIFVTHPMSAGAVHVTNCHMITLVLLETQQLRLHDSTDLTCHVPNPATIGAILEGCTRVVFVIPPSSVPSIAPDQPEDRDNKNNNIAATKQEQQQQQKKPLPQPPLLDAKDFNWLRTGIPSPNFSVIVQEPPPVPIHDVDHDHDHEEPHGESTGTQSNNPTIMTTAPNSATKILPRMAETANGSSESTSTIVETLNSPIAPSATISVRLAEEAPNASVSVHMDGDDEDEDDEL